MVSILLVVVNLFLFNYDNDNNDVSMDIVDEIFGNFFCKSIVDVVIKIKDLIKFDF